MIRLPNACWTTKRNNFHVRSFFVFYQMHLLLLCGLLKGCIMWCNKHCTLIRVTPATQELNPLSSVANPHPIIQRNGRYGRFCQTPLASHHDSSVPFRVANPRCSSNYERGERETERSEWSASMRTSGHLLAFLFFPIIWRFNFRPLARSDFYTISAGAEWRRSYNRSRLSCAAREPVSAETK